MQEHSSLQKASPKAVSADPWEQKGSRGELRLQNGPITRKGQGTPGQWDTADSEAKLQDWDMDIPFPGQGGSGDAFSSLLPGQNKYHCPRLQAVQQTFHTVCGLGRAAEDSRQARTNLEGTSGETGHFTRKGSSGLAYP